MLLLAHDYGFAKSVATGISKQLSTLRLRVISYPGIGVYDQYSSHQNYHVLISHRRPGLQRPPEVLTLRPRYVLQPARAFRERTRDERCRDRAAAESSQNGNDWHSDEVSFSEESLDKVTPPLQSRPYPLLDAESESLGSNSGIVGKAGNNIEAARGQLEDDEDDEIWLTEEKTRPARSRSETYRHRLKMDSENMLELADRKSSPRALKRILQPSPSFHLEQALADIGDPRLLPRPRPRSVHDLSYRNARTLNIFNINGYKPQTSDDTVSLQSITAKFIRSVVRQQTQGDTADVLTDLPSEADMADDGGDLPLNFLDLQVLHSAGYNESDAREWAAILLEPDTELASQRLVPPYNPTPHRNDAGKGTPWFVMNFLLRRERITSQALRQILDFTWQVLVLRQRQSGLADENSQNQPPSLRMVMTVCIRLVRHARDVWPQALPNITKLFATYLLDGRTEYYDKIEKPMRPSLLRQLSFKCNRMLSQLSLSGRRYPVLSAAHQQRAQFDLIRKMMTHQPPLPINQEGHRALTKVLLLLRKTPQERDWALLQARSWPPFKISKTRLDDPKDREYGTSAAGKSIHFMQGYGYPAQNWDLIAQVYSGWNPDGSPAVQQRALTPAVPTSVAGEPGKDELHAAIIASTRTIPEAWAAFLKFDTPDGKWRAIYTAMFKKLLLEKGSKSRRPKPLVHPDNVPAIGGDGIEVFAPPTSPLEAIYLPSEPPTLEALFDTLHGRNFPIFGELMHMLLEKAPSYEFGLKVWSAGKILQITTNGRTSWSTNHLSLLESQPQDYVDVLPDLPHELISALVGFLTTQSSNTTAGFASIDLTQLAAGGWLLRPEHAVVYAYRLLMYYNHPHSSAWNRLLKALTARTSLRHALSHSTRTKERFFPLVAWAMSGNVVRSMVAAGATPDHISFQHLCDITQEAAVPVRRHGVDRAGVLLKVIDGQEDLRREFAEAQLLMSQGSTLLRQRFARLVGLDRDHGTAESGSLADRGAMPSHLAIPKAAVLHKYVRALGLLGDHEGIYSLVRWMVGAAEDLHELQDTQLNGRQHLRRLIVALRVWLECPSRDFVMAERQIRIPPASEELVHLVRSEVEHVKRWGGWPSDEHVDKYCRRHQNYSA